MRKKQIKKVNRFFKLLSHFLVCIIITLIGLIVLKSNADLRNFVYKNVFQSNLKFASINEFYEKYFGSSLPLSEKQSSLSMVSSEKIEYSNLEKYKEGVKLKVSNNYTIPVIKSGIVIFAGVKEDYGNTVIVQTADDIEMWYSNLKDIKVNMYDYLKKGSIIGEADGKDLILVFTKDGKSLDYKKYI